MGKVYIIIKDENGEMDIECFKWEDRTENTLTILTGRWPWNKRRILLTSKYELKGFFLPLRKQYSLLNMVLDLADESLTPITEDLDILEVMKNSFPSKDRKVENLKQMIRILAERLGKDFEEGQRFMTEVVDSMKTYSNIALDSLLNRDELFKNHLGLQLDAGDLAAIKKVFAERLAEQLERKVINIPNPEDFIRNSYQKVEAEPPPRPRLPTPPPPEPVAELPAPKPSSSSRKEGPKKWSKKGKSDEKSVDSEPFNMSDPEHIKQLFQDLESGDAKFFRNGEEIEA